MSAKAGQTMEELPNLKIISGPTLGPAGLVWVFKK
jgi:hypothetical protein